MTRRHQGTATPEAGSDRAGCAHAPSPPRARARRDNRRRRSHRRRPQGAVAAHRRPEVDRRVQALGLLKQVEHRLGKPDTATQANGKFGITYDRYKLSFGFDTTRAGDPLASIGALGPRYRTIPHHIHVGSTRKAVRRAFPKVKCPPGLCALYQGQPGAPGTRSTGFAFLNGKVNEIELQLVR